MNESFKWSPRDGRSQEEVDRINKAFYGKFNYPWPPMAFYAFTDQQFPITILNQDIGDWEHKIIPEKPEIWVAGCGTNQAVFTALKFPNSNVLGTDLSAESLKTCENSAKQLGITNLELEEKSINQVNYHEEFDYIICTGVIHHNADPGIALHRLAAALKPAGILELMVYNYYHMLFDGSYQEAIRLLCKEQGSSENVFDVQLAATKELIVNFPVRNLMADHLSKFREVHDDAELADLLLQPVLHSYTIETFAELISNSDLECLLPCVNQFDKVNRRLTWNLQCEIPDIAGRYEALTDMERWQISNLLMMERSPMIWFYLQRKDSGRKRKTEKEVCDEFLNMKFKKCSTPVRVYSLTQEGRYVLSPVSLSEPNPPVPVDEVAGKIFDSIDPVVPMKDIFRRLDLPTTFYHVNCARINLTTSAFPYLRAVYSKETREKKSFAGNTRQDEGDFGF